MRLIEEKDPALAVRYLEAWRAGLEAILCRGEEEGYTVGWVLQEVLHGRLRFYHAVEECDPRGFVLALVDLRRPRRPTLYVWGLAVDATRAWHREMADELDHIAREAGCVAVAARSPRPGWARWARKLGWRPGAIEYTKELA
jgi:hypothetical protein